MAHFDYLTEAGAEAELAAGRSIQQWLGVRTVDGFRFIHWVEVDPGQATWTVFEKDSLDAGSPGPTDMTTLHNDNDPDLPEGRAYRCASPSGALAVCASLGCSMDRFVRFCEIQQQYDALLMAEGPSRPANEYFQL